MYILWRRMYSTSSRLALAHSSGSSHPAFVVIPMPTFPQAEQFLLIVKHESLHFILHVTLSFVLVIFVNNPAHPLCIFCFPLLFPRLQLLLVLSQLFLHCSGNLTHPCSCLFSFLDCVARVNTSVPIRSCAFTSQPHSNLSRVGDRPSACVDKSWSSFITCRQPKHAQIRYCCSRSLHVHDLRHALHSSDPMMTSSLLLPMMCLISSRASLSLKSRKAPRPSTQKNRDGSGLRQELVPRSFPPWQLEINDGPRDDTHFHKGFVKWVV